MTAQRRTRRA